MTYKKTKIFSIFLLLILSFQFTFLSIIDLVKADPEFIPDFKKNARINPNQRVTYFFNNSIEFDLFTNVMINNLSIEYESQIQSRQISLIITNNESISLNFTSKKDMNDFGMSKTPKEPMIGGYQLRNNYGCIYQIISNHTIENLTIQYYKKEFYGLNPESRYSFVVIKEDQDSWTVINPIERVNQSTSETYLEITLLDFEGDIEYFFTIYEVNEIIPDLTWLIFIIIFITVAGIISLIIVISKDDFIHYIKTRSTPIDKGAHRLSLDDVLENENRNKIIELILDSPGIHFNELLRKTGLAAGNLVWHLEILNKYKIIGKKDIGRYVAYFPYYPKNPISNLDLKLQKSKFTLQILELIENEPGIWNSVIKKRMNVDHKTIYYHTSKLVDLNLVITKKDGRKKRFYPNFESDYYMNKNSS